MASADLTVLEYIAEATQGVTPDNGVKASRVLTGTANFADTETVTIGTKVYTFQAVLTNVDGNVKVGADLEASLANLKNAINLGVGAGSTYAAAMTKHPQVSATSDATTLTATSLLSGTAYNTIATTEASANSSWAGATLTGGTNSTITTWKQLRFTGESLNFSIENTSSNEIRPDRSQADLVQTSASGAGDVNVEYSYSSYDDFIEAALCGTWAANVVKNGTTRRFFTVRKHFQDMTPQQYHLYRGTAIEGFTLNAEIGQIVSGSFNLMSFGIDPDTGIMEAGIGGETSTAAPSTVPMNAVTNFRDFTLDGVPYSGCISSMSLTLKNNIRAIMCIGSLTAKDMRLGSIEITGNMEFYFNDPSIYNKFVKGTELDINFALQDALGNRLDFDLPRVKFETGEAVASGKNSDVMLSATYRALYHAGSAYMMQITRTPA